MIKTTPVDALNRAIKLAGGQSSLADKLPLSSGGKPVSQARVSYWVNRDKKAPTELCPDIEALTGVPCEELRPDVNWAVLRKQRRKNRTTAAAERDRRAKGGPPFQGVEAGVA